MADEDSSKKEEAKKAIDKSLETDSEVSGADVAGESESTKVPPAESVDPKESKPEPETSAASDLDDDLAEAMEEESSEAGDEPVDIDDMIAEADPDFAKEMGEINSADFANADIKKDASVEEGLDEAKAPSAFKSFLKNMPKEVRTRYIAAAVIVALMLPLAGLIFSGYLLPKFDLPYVVTMDELTQKVYTYPTDGVYVPLFDELRSKAVTFPLPKATISLKKTGDTTSYGNFEFFLSLRDKDLVPQVELKKSEIVDLIQRTLEEVTWGELQTPVGKERVKKVIRRRINEHLQGNLVLGVYYRSVILQK